MGLHNVRLEAPITWGCRHEFTHKVRIPHKRRTSPVLRCSHHVCLERKRHVRFINMISLSHPDVTRPLSIAVAFYGGSSRTLWGLSRTLCVHPQPGRSQCSRCYEQPVVQAQFEHL